MIFSEIKFEEIAETTIQPAALEISAL